MAGDGGAGPRKLSMRVFQASHARRSPSLRAAAARSAWARTEALKRYSRDLVVFRQVCPSRARRAIAAGWNLIVSGHHRPVNSDPRIFLEDRRNGFRCIDIDPAETAPLPPGGSP